MKKLLFALMMVTVLSVTSVFAIEPVPFRQSPTRRGEPIVVPHVRVGKFTLGMTRWDIERMGTPQGVRHMNGQTVYTFGNDTTGNALTLWMTNDIVSLICFTNPKFDTADGISTENFDFRMRSTEVVKGKTYYATGGLFYYHNTADRTADRWGCVTR